MVRNIGKLRTHSCATLRHTPKIDEMVSSLSNLSSSSIDFAPQLKINFALKLYLHLSISGAPVTVPSGYLYIHCKACGYINNRIQIKCTELGRTHNKFNGTSVVFLLLFCVQLFAYVTYAHHFIYMFVHYNGKNIFINYARTIVFALALICI